MKYIIYTLLVIPTLLHAHLKDWDKRDQLLWKSYVALNVLDTYQTFDLIDKQKDPNYNLKEANPILGSNPRKGELVVLKIVISSLAYKFIHENPRHRTMTLGIMNGIYLRTVQNNHEIGLRIDFKI